METIKEDIKELIMITREVLAEDAKDGIVQVDMPTREDTHHKEERSSSQVVKEDERLTMKGIEDSKEVMVLRQRMMDKTTIRKGDSKIDAQHHQRDAKIIDKER